MNGGMLHVDFDTALTTASNAPEPEKLTIHSLAAMMEKMPKRPTRRCADCNQPMKAEEHLGVFIGDRTSNLCPACDAMQASFRDLRNRIRFSFGFLDNR